MSNEITVTLPLKDYNQLLKESEHNHVKNFIHKRFSDYDKNIYTVAVDQEAVMSRFGYPISNIDLGVQQENMNLREVLKEISEISNTHGSMSVGLQLEKVISKAKNVLIFN